MIAHVLVVDDDPIQRRLLKNAVERFGHVAHLAENGLVALDFLQNLSGPVNVIVLDLMMPEMDGLSFLSTIRSMGIDTPVIVQTGQGGAIPLCVTLSEAHPDAEILLIGVEEPACRIHAPDESVSPDELRRTAVAEALLLRALSAGRGP